MPPVSPALRPAPPSRPSASRPAVRRGASVGEWWRHGVIYQVYPRSFQDSNGDGIGDLRGIITRLDHLADGTTRSLGIDAIWLSPFYPSPMADFGYDVSDHCDVHPDYGTLADFDALLGEAHARDIRVIVDFVPNHTSSEHPWFRASRSSRSDPKRDWYVWRDPAPGGGPPNNWRSTFKRVGPAWTFDAGTGQYYLHSFLPEQPDLDWSNPAVESAMGDVLRFWLDRGVDGFRIDVAHKMARDPELRDNPPDLDAPGVRRYDEDWEPDVHDHLRRFRRILDAYDDRMAVGEVFLLDPRRMVRYHGEAMDELHLAFNFAFLRQPWRAEAFRSAVDLYESILPAGAWPDYALSNHDNPRARSRYDDGDAATGRRRARVGALMLLTLRGTPFLYQGEEIAQADGEVSAERVVDVAGRDPERTPIQWERAAAAGFTTGQPWLPIGPEASEGVTVDEQRDDPASMLSFVRRAIHYRKASAPLRAGTYRSVDLAPGVFAYLREHGGERLLVVLDFEGRARRLDAVTVTDGDAVATIDLSTDPERSGSVDLRAFDLAADEGVVLRLRQGRRA